MGSCISNPKEQVIRDRHDKLKNLTYKEAEDITYDFKEAKVLKVYDGDSMTIGAYYFGKYHKFNVRIFGIDCDELKGGTEKTRENAQRAKKYVEQLILNKVVEIEVLNNRIVDGKKLKEKFGRLLVKIKDPNGNDVGDSLFIAGLARRYYGGKKDTSELHPKVDISINSTDEKMGSEKDSLEY